MISATSGKLRSPLLADPFQRSGGFSILGDRAAPVLTSSKHKCRAHLRARRTRLPHRRAREDEPARLSAPRTMRSTPGTTALRAASHQQTKRPDRRKVHPARQRMCGNGGVDDRARRGCRLLCPPFVSTKVISASVNRCSVNTERQGATSAVVKCAASLYVSQICQSSEAPVPLLLA